MYGRTGLDRFKKASTLEPFSVSNKSASKTTTTQTAQSAVNNSSIQHSESQSSFQNSTGHDVVPNIAQAQPVTQTGGGQSSWQPPDWANEPRPGVYYLEILKDGEVIGRINLDKRRHIFGRQFHMCDYVLDHQSVSRQHAAVVPHKNGSIYVIDLGSAHGTFVANERLTRDAPVELEAGQSLRFAASTRAYILRKNSAALFTRHPPPTEIDIPSTPPDPTDEEAVVAYNTLLNRYGLNKFDVLSKSKQSGAPVSVNEGDESHGLERPSKRVKTQRVTFRDQVGGDLVEVVGISDGADVETEPGPLGVKEGSLVGKYESLVQTIIIPKGKEHISLKEDNNGSSQKGVTNKLQEVLNKVKSTPKTGFFDDLYGESLSSNLGSSWAYSSNSAADKTASPTRESKVKSGVVSKPGNNITSYNDDNDDDDDDLFGD